MTPTTRGSISVPPDLSLGNVLACCTADKFEPLHKYDPRHLTGIFWSTCPSGSCPQDHPLWSSMTLSHRSVSAPPELLKRCQGNIQRAIATPPGLLSDPGQYVSTGPKDPPYALTIKGAPSLKKQFDRMRINDLALKKLPKPKANRCRATLVLNGHRIDGTCKDLSGVLKKDSHWTLGMVENLHVNGQAITSPCSRSVVAKFLSIVD